MLKLQGITKEYPLTNTDKVLALKGIDLEFRRCEFVSILGQSGCGKTTLLNIIGGLDHYTEGDLFSMLGFDEDEDEDEEGLELDALEEDEESLDLLDGLEEDEEDLFADEEEELLDLKDEEDAQDEEIGDLDDLEGDLDEDLEDDLDDEADDHSDEE